MLGEGAVGWCVFLGDGDEGVGVCCYGGDDLGKGTVGVSAVVFADGGAGVDGLEEWEGDVVYGKGVAGFPLSGSVVEEFRRACGY